MRKSAVVSLFLIAICNPFGIWARTVIERTIEPAIIEIVYERIRVRDTLDMQNDFDKGLLTLKVGRNVSAFYNAELKSTDSIEYRSEDAVMARLKDNNVWKAKAKLPRDKMFKNFPEGKITTHDRFDFCNWSIVEDIEKPVWNISDSTSTVMGFDCLMAETEFKGRHWIAWFSPEIPIPDGPWKLCGLPGIILKAYDSKSHYTFTATSVSTSGVGDVEYFDYDAGNRLNIKRARAMPLKLKWLHTDIGYKIVSSGMYGLSNPNLKEKKVIPHTNYDFEETDYPHEYQK